MMKVYVSSLGLPKGFPIQEYENLDEVRKDGGDVLVEYNGKKVDAITANVNSYLHQKGALVEGRNDLFTWISTQTSFPRAPKSPAATKTVKKTVNGKEVTTTEPVMETEGVYIDRFIAALATNTFKTDKLTVTGTEPGARETSAWEAIQALVETPVTITIKVGEKSESVKLFDLRNDIKRPIVTAKPKNPPAYALEAAGNIITNKSEAKWAKTFTTEGLVFDDFTVANDPEGNKTRLAWAIQAREAAILAKKAKSYV